LKHKVAVEDHGKARGGLLKPNPKSLPFDAPVALPVFEEEDYLTDAQVMAWLHVKKQWLADHRTRVEPIIPHIPMGKQILYPKSAVQAWLDRLVETRPSWKRKPASPALTDRKRSPASFMYESSDSLP
jgi:hypothetical protein